MNQHFKAASNRYKDLLPENKKESGYLINPISTVDCEIITELFELLKKAGFSKAVAILREYKGQVKDTEILDQLMQCNIDTKSKALKEAYEEELEEGFEKKFKRDFIQIEGHRIEIAYIFGYFFKDNSDDDFEEYKIILNPCRSDATRIPLYANQEFVFYDFVECQKTIKTIDNYLEQSNIKFVNKEQTENNEG